MFLTIMFALNVKYKIAKYVHNLINVMNAKLLLVLIYCLKFAGKYALLVCYDIYFII